MCSTPCMVVSLVTRHLCDCHPCHFAHTHHNVCCSLRTMVWFECTMHIACFHLVVTTLVSINQPWWVFHHQVCVVEHLVHVLWWWWWLCLKPVITKIDYVACSCEKSTVNLPLSDNGVWILLQFAVRGGAMFYIGISEKMVVNK